MAYQSPRVAFVRDNIVRVHHPDPIEPSTFLTANASATATSLTVKNNAGLANGDILLFEGYGAKNAEIKKITAAVSAGSALTAVALTFAHNVSAAVMKTLFDQVEISGASTVGGSKTVIATVGLNVSGPYTDYIVAGSTYSYYFARYYNSLNDTPYYSSYSDACAATDYDPKNVGFIRRNAFLNIDQEYAGKFADPTWVYDQCYLCELDVLKEKDHWSELIIEDYDLGNITTGVAAVTLPTDIEDENTNKSITGLRIGSREGMLYVDRADFEWLRDGVAHSTNSAEVAIGATTVTLTDSRDFADSGSINIAGTSYSYTTNTRSTGVLSGFTAFAATVTASTDIWQGVSFGEPRRFTVSDGTAYFDIPPSSDWSGRNIWIDYARGANRPDSDGDSVLFPDYPQLYISWIEMAIKKRKASGELPPNDGVVLAYERQKAKLILRDRNKVGIRFIPDVPVTRRRRPYSWVR